jgi:tetratricopeptide (TPR) repeat protein
MVLLAQYDEVLASTQDLRPITPSEWVLFHIRGMALMLNGDFHKAITVFEEGVRKDPRPSSQAYFVSALAAARIRLHEFRRAAETLELSRLHQLHVPATVLRIHAHGELGDRDTALRAYDSLQRLRLRKDVGRIVVELHDRYLNGNTPRHSVEWLVNQESRMLLLG